MLTPRADHAFPHVRVRNVARLLSPDEAATLRQEVAGAPTEASGRLSAGPNDLGGISGDISRWP
jgi:hypothetical protein